MDIFFVILFYFCCILLAGWVIMLLAGAFGFALGYGTCVGIACGLTILKILI